MGTFTNIAKPISDWKVSSNANATIFYNVEKIAEYSDNGIYLEVSSNFPALYEPRSIIRKRNGNGELYIVIQELLTTPIVSGHKYYASYWVRTVNESRTTELFIGSNINDSEDLIVSSGAITTGTWTRVSGIKALSDNGGKKARIDMNEGSNSQAYMGFSGFLVVDLTTHGLQDKSKDWLDNHLYYVESGQSGTYTDYYESYSGTNIDAYSTGKPNVSDLKTLYDLVINKSSNNIKRNGSSVENMPEFVDATWLRTIKNNLDNMYNKGSKYGTCAVYHQKPTDLKSSAETAIYTTDCSVYSDNFYGHGMSTINNLIYNADAYYAQQPCIQKTLTYTTKTCDEDGCYGFSCCQVFCCDHEYEYCCYIDYACHDCCDETNFEGGGFDPDCCNNDTHHYCTELDVGRKSLCCNVHEGCGNCSCNQETCNCVGTCSCNSVCSCNWV